MSTTDFPCTTNDAFIKGFNPVYATSRSTAYSFDSVNNCIVVGQCKYGANYEIFRGFLKFDTTSLSNSVIINQVNIGLVVYDDYSTIDFDVCIMKQNWSSYDPITSGNMDTIYDACLSGTYDGTWRNTYGMSVNTKYYSDQLDTHHINPGGYTYYSLISSRDIAGITPGSEYIRFYSQEYHQYIPSYAPVLRIIYTNVGKTMTAYMYD